MSWIALVTKYLRAWLFGFLPWPEPPGVAAYGQVDRTSPVLLTGNSGLTTLMISRELSKFGVYLLTVDTGGRDLLSSAAGGCITAQLVSTAIAESGLGDKVEHRRVLLSRVLEGIVQPDEVKRACGWEVVWGPLAIEELADATSGANADISGEEMPFALGERLRIACSLALPSAILMALPGLIAGPIVAAWILGLTWVVALLWGIFLPFFSRQYVWISRLLFSIVLGLIVGSGRFFLLGPDLFSAAAWAGAVLLIGLWISILYPPRTWPLSRSGREVDVPRP